MPKPMRIYKQIAHHDNAKGGLTFSGIDIGSIGDPTVFTKPYSLPFSVRQMLWY